MKKIYFLLLACITASLFSACSLKEDDYFDQSASERSDNNMKNIKTVLQSAPNGWLVEFYGNLNFGGYNMMMKFESDSAIVASEKWGPSHNAGIDATTGKMITVKSHYKLEQSMGSVLSFDDYNEVLHYFSMPNNPDYTYDASEGLSGDFEFRVMKATADSVIMRGKKSNNKIVLTPIAADKTWESIVQEVNETETYMSSRSYTLTGSDRKDTTDITVTSNGGYRCLVFEYKDSFDMKQTVLAPYIVKKDGYYFYSEVEVNGMKLNGLEKGTTDDYFLFRNNHNLQLDSYMPTLAEALVTGTWYQLYSEVGEKAKPYWDAMLEKLKTAGKNNDEVKIYTATIGLSSDKLACSLTTSLDAPIWGFNATSLEDGKQVKLVQNSSVKNKAGKEYYNQLGWKNVLNCLYSHTFNLSCDYQRRPTWIKLTDVNDPTNVITVYSNPMYFMDDPEYYKE